MIVFEECKSYGYRKRTETNASADITLAFATNFTTSGEVLTKNSCKNQGKNYIAIDANNMIITEERINKLIEKINRINYNDPITINIAGNGLYTMKNKYKQEECDKFVLNFLEKTIGKTKNPIRFIRSGGQSGFDESGLKASVRLGIPALCYAPKGWLFRDENGVDISSEKLFKERFKDYI